MAPGGKKKTPKKPPQNDDNPGVDPPIFDLFTQDPESFRDQENDDQAEVRDEGDEEHQNDGGEEGDDDEGDDEDDEAEDQEEAQAQADLQTTLLTMQKQIGQIMASLGSKDNPTAPTTAARRLPNLRVPPPKARLPPIKDFDNVGLSYYTGAKDKDGTNPVALVIDREVLDRRAIHHADNDAKPQDYRYALGGYDHLEPVRTYCMLTSPREFDIWKDLWKDHISKVARGVHPARIKEKCMLEMKGSLSTTTWHWIENRHELDGKRDDPDAILHALQEHAHQNANVANMLLKATQTRANANSNHVETNSTIATVVHYFQKACKGNIIDGIHKWLLLITYGDNEKLCNKLVDKWEKLDRHEFFRLIENFFETNKKSSGLFASGEAYSVSTGTFRKGQGQNNHQNRQKPKPQQQQQQKPQQQQQPRQNQGNQGQNQNGNSKCYFCGGPATQPSPVSSRQSNLQKMQSERPHQRCLQSITTKSQQF